MRTLLLTSAALVAFASNSLLTRGALGHDLIDAASFTIIRLATGALALAVLVRMRTPHPTERGSWGSALALAGYAVAFTVAYTRISAGVGALFLFGAVQVTMISVGVARGERPLSHDWLGLLIATAGLVWLTVPGASAPDGLGALLMVAAGICWGAYSIAGRRNLDPLAATAGNFLRATLLGTVALGALASPGDITGRGALLAAASGAIASGLGYTVWYTALPSLAAWRAALVQLPVPVLTALAAVLFLGESITMRLITSTALVCGGVALTLIGTRRP